MDTETKENSSTITRLSVQTEARGLVTEKEEKAPREPRVRETSSVPRAPKQVEEQLSLEQLIRKEIEDEDEGAFRLGKNLAVEKRSEAIVSTEVSAEKLSKRKTAETLSTKQRDISVSEFFAKNRHLLGFDNPAKSLLTAIKEAVDNALDACEEARILPSIAVSVEEVSPERFRISIEDNGPGILKQQIPKIFGRLLYGSKFHSRRQSRGQQGIGISAAGMYGQLTTGKPMQIISRSEPEGPAYYCEMALDTRNNRAQILKERNNIEWRPGTGTKVSLELAGIYKKGRHSVDAYLQQTAIANPHAEFLYLAPRTSEWLCFPRQTDQLPIEPLEIKPHPHGIELGVLIQMLQDTDKIDLLSCLAEDFSRVTPQLATEICQQAGISPAQKPSKTAAHEAEALYQAIQNTKIAAPPTNCLSPIGEDLIRKGLASGIEGAEFYDACTRPPAVYRGIPYQVEVGIAYGGKLPQDEPCDVYRYANRVPLLYQQSACGVSKAVMGAGWRSYGLSQPKGALPIGPLVLVVHIASVWVPFTSESKEAIAHYPEILREIRLGVQDCARKLGSHIRRQKKANAENKKRSYIDKYIPHISGALRDLLKLTDVQEKTLQETLEKTLERNRRQMMPAAMRRAEEAEEAAAAAAALQPSLFQDGWGFAVAENDDSENTGEDLLAPENEDVDEDFVSHESEDAGEE